MSRISIPTKARLPSTLRVDPSNPAVSKILSRLSRNSLISVALDWLKDERIPLSRPYIRQRHEEEDDDDDEDDFYPVARSVLALRELYEDLQARKGSKREVLDRITEGDWRHGLSLYQLAIADLQYLYDHPTSQKWTAYRIVALKTTTTNDDNAADDDNPKLEVDKESLAIPRFHPSTFLQSLQETTLPDVKAHYSFDRHQSLPILLLRIFILDSPYNTNLSLQSSGATFDVSRTIYIAFPDDSPHIFISRPQTLSSTTPGQSGAAAAAGGGESKSLRSLILEGIPKALSRPPHQRYTLKSTNLVTKNLTELLERRGATRTNSAGGGWSIYADESVKESPLDIVLPLSPPLSVTDDDSASNEDEEMPEERERRKRERAAKRRPMSPASKRDERALKRARLVAKARFGNSGRVDDGRGVERVDIVIEDAFPSVAAVGDGAVAASRKRRRHEEDADDDGHDRTTRNSGKGRKSNMDLALHGEDDEDEEQQEQQNTSGHQSGEGNANDRRESQWRPNIKITFHGSHVFAGIRQLVERGVIDGERMPGWMTGEEGVTIGIVRNGRIKGHKGAGL